MSKGYDFLGEKIKKLRNLKGFTQKELGDAVGLPKQSISMIENGGRSISSEELEKACNFMHVPVDFILKDGWLEKFGEKYEYKPINKWGIMVPPFIDEMADGLENYFDELANSGYSTVRMNIKYIQNIIKLYQEFLKEYKEKNK
jgi:transcriptional regulator with XRE-family HTH domain